MQVVAHPAVTPTSQVQGTAEGNADAMAPQSHADIPVSTQEQPNFGIPRGPIVFESMKGAK